MNTGSHCSKVHSIMEDFPSKIKVLQNVSKKKKTDDISESIPLVPDLSSVVEHSSTNRDTSPPDVAFLKKITLFLLVNVQ